MYADGTQDLMMMIAVAPFKTPKEKEESYDLILSRAKTRYFPVFEKVSLYTAWYAEYLRIRLFKKIDKVGTRG